MTRVPTRGLAASALVGAIALVAALGSSASSAKTAVAAPRPNVVVIRTDDQTVESLRAMPNVRTLLVDKGVTFTNSFASNPLLSPSDSTYLTGQYAHNNGVWSNVLPNGGYEKLDHTNTLAVWLQRAGYQTVHLGEYLNEYGSRRPTEVPPGWAEWRGLVTTRYLGYRMNEGGVLVDYGNDAASYQTDVLARKAVDVINRQALDPRPFFLSVAFAAPRAGAPRDPDDPTGFATPAPALRHRNAFATVPLPAPASLNEADVTDKPASIRGRVLMTPQTIAAVQENYQQRLESLLAVDEAVAGIVGALTATGKLDNTFVFFTSVNGFMHGEHRVPSGKTVLYEPSIRVPLVFRGPRIPQGQQRSQLVANVDLAPTIVEATRARAGRVMDGRSLLGFARDPLLHSGRDILLETPTYAAIRTPRWVYAEHVTGERELYDLARDPNQLSSLHFDLSQTRTMSELSQRLARLRGCAAAVCRRGPELSLRFTYRRGRARSARRSCTGSSTLVAVGGPSARRVSQASFFLDGRFVRRDLRAPFTARVPRRLVKRYGSTIEVLLTLGDSRRQTLARRLSGCRP